MSPESGEPLGLWADLDAESKKPGPTMTITKAQYLALRWAASEAQGTPGWELSRAMTEPLPPEGPRTEAGRALLEVSRHQRHRWESWADSLPDRILAIEREAASPALDVERLSDSDLVMLRAAIAQEQQRRYAEARLTPEPSE